MEELGGNAKGMNYGARIEWVMKENDTYDKRRKNVHRERERTLDGGVSPRGAVGGAGVLFRAAVSLMNDT